ncbi:MAG: glycosyltransferase family 4 protein [Ignavibacterium sp.]
MKVLLVTDDLFPGGVQRHVTDLANRLSESGHDVAVAAAGGSFRKRLCNAVRFHDVPLARGSHRTFVNATRAVKELIRIVREGEFDILHSHMRYSDLFGRICALLAGIGHVSTCHSIFTNHRWSSVFGYQIIAPSQAVKQVLVELYGKPPASVTVIYNDPYPMAKIAPQRLRDLKKQYGIDRTSTTLFSISRFVHEKDIATSLQALSLLRKQGIKSLKYFLVGYGELHDSILRLIRSLGLEEWVHILPGTSDVGEVIGMSDAGVLSSRSEGGIPYVILEAASLGKPVVASATAATMEFVRHGDNGMLYPVGDAAGLAACVQQLVRNRALRVQLGRQALKKYRDYHAANRSLEYTLAVYEKVRARARG